jgi:hypothetical protein
MSMAGRRVVLPPVPARNRAASKPTIIPLLVGLVVHIGGCDCGPDYRRGSLCPALFCLYASSLSLSFGCPPQQWAAVSADALSLFSRQAEAQEGTKQMSPL